MPPARARAALLAVTALLLTALLSGCGVGIETGGGGGRTSDPIDEVDTDSLAGDERAAVGVTDAFWQQEFPATFGRSYRSPEVKGGYRGDNGPTCGGQQSVAFNAFYCPSEDFLAWDENLMAAGYRQIGDAWVYLIIAHEWGHAIQARLDRGRVSMAADDYPWTSQQDHGNARQRIGAFNTGVSRGVGACA